MAFAAVVVAVALLHVTITRSIAERLAAAGAEAAMPQRLAVAYVTLVEPTAPPSMAPVIVAAAKPRARAPRVPEVAEAAASAASAASAVDAAADRIVASVDEPMAVASSPEPRAEPEPEVAIAAAPPSVSASSAMPFEWPASTRVSYVLTGNYRGEVTGQARVEWVRQGARYQVNYDFLVGPEFAPLISRRATSEGRIDDEGLVPERYDEETNVIFRDRRRATVVFEPTEVVLADGKRQARLAGVQDTASQFIQLTYLFTTHPERLRVGEKIDFPLALPRGMDRHVYEVVGEETLTLPFGAIDTFHLKPTTEKKKNALAVEIWFAPSLRFLPVRIRVAQDETNYVDMLIDRKPEMAAS
ncbi:MAG: DUF3108 domain-containing protein [Caldimonas sp.]